MRLTYHLDGEPSLLQGLHVVREVETEMGIKPTRIELPNKKLVEYSRSDYLRLEKGLMTEEEYIERNTLPF